VSVPDIDAFVTEVHHTEYSVWVTLTSGSDEHVYGPTNLNRAHELATECKAVRDVASVRIEARDVYKTPTRKVWESAVSEPEVPSG